MSISKAFYQAYKNKYPDQYYDWKDHQPVLKQGYSTSGDIGGSEKVHTIKGKAKKYQRWGGGKDSYKWTGGSPDINIYKLPEQKAAPAPVAPPPEPKPEPEPEAPVVLSDTAAKAEAYTQAYENVILPRQGDYTAGGDTTVIDDFNTDYSLRLGKAKEPQGLDDSEALAARSEAKERAQMRLA